jgi:universal stress protein A
MEPIGSFYKHILVGLDLSESCTYVLKRAVALASACNATLSIAHAIEPMSFAYGGDMPVDLSGVQEQQIHRAEILLAELAQNCGYPIRQTHVLVGQPASEIHYLSEQTATDLIVVGSRGRKGLALLLGSTSSGVLHGSFCDVFAVMVKKSGDNDKKTSPHEDIAAG